MSARRSIVLVACIGSLFLGSAAFAQVAVHGYTRKDGTYVQPYERTAPNNTRNDNYSTQGNVNPYTGQPGTKPRDEGAYGAYQTPSYSAPQPNPYASPYDAPTAPSASAYGQKPAKSPYGF